MNNNMSSFCTGRINVPPICKRKANVWSVYFQYTHAAQQFFNCSCNVTSHGVPPVKVRQNDERATDTLEMVHQERHESAVKLKETVAKEPVTSKEEKGSLFVAALNVQRHCQSTVLENYNSVQESKRNVCDICQTCCRMYGCSRFTDLKINRQRLQKQFRADTSRHSKTCSSLANSYNPGVTTSVCCVEMVKKPKQEAATQKEDKGELESLMEFDVELREIADQWVDRLTKLLESRSKEEGPSSRRWVVEAEKNGDTVLIKGSKQTMSDEEAGKDSVITGVADQKSKRRAESGKSAGTRTDEENQKNTETPKNGDSKPADLFAKVPSSDSGSSCLHTGRVVEFQGAGCLSNRSLNFFYMDSGQYWMVAERLGVTTNKSRAKTALVIVDLKVSTPRCCC